MISALQKLKRIAPEVLSSPENDGKGVRVGRVGEGKNKGTEASCGSSQPTDMYWDLESRKRKKCSPLHAQHLSSGQQIERERLTSMKCFAVTLP